MFPDFVYKAWTIGKIGAAAGLLLYGGYETLTGNTGGVVFIIIGSGIFCDCAIGHVKIQSVRDEYEICDTPMVRKACNISNK